MATPPNPGHIKVSGLTGVIHINNIIVADNDLHGNKATAPLFIGSTVGVVISNNNLGVDESVTRTGTTTFGRTEKTIFYNQSAAVTATLPSAALVPQNARFTVVDKSGNASTNNISVTSAGGNVNGVTTYVAVNTNYGRTTFASDGTNWFTV